MRARTLLLIAALGIHGLAQAADLRISEAWVRGTVTGQKNSPAYMVFETPRATAIVGASSPRADKVELHEMQMPEGRDLMTMKRVERIEIPPGKPYKLIPLGSYIMLVGLKKGVDAGERIPITLQIEQDGKRSEVVVQAEGRSFYPGK
ncbi:MAG: copper chaperone PCu(A)C [Moraxellaceae bacterium]|nr:copper chaperone PCu(A)C [Moraxellaceae bacterium]